MTFTTMCGAPALLKITICQAIIWMGNLCTFIGTTLYIPYLVYPLDLFETGSVMACAMVLGIVGASWMSHKVDITILLFEFLIVFFQCARKWLVIVFAFLCGGSLIGSGLLMFYLPAQSAAILTLAVLGKFFSAGKFSLVLLFSMTSSAFSSVPALLTNDTRLLSDCLSRNRRRLLRYVLSTCVDCRSICNRSSSS